MVTLGDQGFYQALQLLQNGIDKGISYHNMFRPGGTNWQEQAKTNSQIQTADAQRQAMANENARAIERNNLALQGLNQAGELNASNIARNSIAGQQIRQQMGSAPLLTASTLEQNKARLGLLGANARLLQLQADNLKNGQQPTEYYNNSGSAVTYGNLPGLQPTDDADTTMASAPQMQQESYGDSDSGDLQINTAITEAAPQTRSQITNNNQIIKPTINDSVVDTSIPLDQQTIQISTPMPDTLGLPVGQGAIGVQDQKGKIPVGASFSGQGLDTIDQGVSQAIMENANTNANALNTLKGTLNTNALPQPATQIDPRFNTANNELAALNGLDMEAMAKKQRAQNAIDLAAQHPVQKSEISELNAPFEQGQSQAQVIPPAGNSINTPIDASKPFQSPARVSGSVSTPLTPEEIHNLAFNNRNGLMPYQGGNTKNSGQVEQSKTQAAMPWTNQSTKVEANLAAPVNPGAFVEPKIDIDQLRNSPITTMVNGKVTKRYPSEAEISKFVKDTHDKAYDQWGKNYDRYQKFVQTNQELAIKKQDHDITISEHINKLNGASGQSASAIKTADSLLEKAGYLSGAAGQAYAGASGLRGSVTPFVVGTAANIWRGITSFGAGDARAFNAAIEELKSNNFTSSLGSLKDIVKGRFNQTEIEHSQELITKLDANSPTLPQQLAKLKDSLRGVQYTSALQASAIKGEPPEPQVLQDFVNYAANSPRYNEQFPGLRSKDPIEQHKAVVSLMNTFYSK